MLLDLYRNISSTILKCYMFSTIVCKQLIPITKRTITPRILVPPLTRTFRFITTSQRMSSAAASDKTHFTSSSSAPGEHFEARQTAPSEDYTPDLSKSLPLSKARQSLVDDIIALYGCQPTVQRVKRYTPDCVYDDQFVYANDRYKMAGQWFALPKLFKASKNEGYQIVVNDKDLIQLGFDPIQECAGGFLTSFPLLSSSCPSLP